MFIGYASSHKGYQCFELSSSKIYISRHVTFTKDVFPFSNIPGKYGQHSNSNHANDFRRFLNPVSFLLPPSILPAQLPIFSPISMSSLSHDNSNPALSLLPITPTSHTSPTNPHVSHDNPPPSLLNSTESSPKNPYHSLVNTPEYSPFISQLNSHNHHDLPFPSSAKFAHQIPNTNLHDTFPIC